ncbi:MAG TPA: S-methyl-5-thioribose-1-phosphate isomerase [Thermoanaerobaculia bacterium]|nr:S-methyl-5-thioribose-1-phosphate isomerase [Thermoanaerobaculia bacterium]
MIDQPLTSSSATGQIFSPIRWGEGELLLLDQTVLPAREEWLRCRHPEQVADAIRRLAVRGAPAIGVAAAFGLVLAIDPAASDPAALAESFASARRLLLATRPTAVNLRWALDRGAAVMAEASARGENAAALRETLLAWAQELRRRDIEANLAIGANGATLFADSSRVLTHCNTGSLATAGFGTALGVIQAAHDAGRVAQVWVDETRPLLQGARLTAWELRRLKIPFRLITDSSAGALMARGEVDAVVVGADRIAANGDVANKIGTYTLAVLARHHGVPFYVAAPLTTVDLATPSGDAIPIEERACDEVVEMHGARIAPTETAALNLAFDVTPAELVTAIVTDAGVLRPPYTESLRRAVEAE